MALHRKILFLIFLLLTFRLVFGDVKFPDLEKPFNNPKNNQNDNSKIENKNNIWQKCGSDNSSMWIKICEVSKCKKRQELLKFSFDIIPPYKLSTGIIKIASNFSYPVPSYLNPVLKQEVKNEEIEFKLNSTYYIKPENKNSLEKSVEISRYSLIDKKKY